MNQRMLTSYSHLVQRLQLFHRQMRKANTPLMDHLYHTSYTGHVGAGR